jgi:hypothetical protein
VNLLALIGAALAGAVLALTMAYLWHEDRIARLNRIAGSLAREAAMLADLWRALDPADRPVLTLRQRLALSLASMADQTADSLAPQRRS